VDLVPYMHKYRIKIESPGTIPLRRATEANLKHFMPGNQVFT